MLSILIWSYCFFYYQSDEKDIDGSMSNSECKKNLELCVEGRNQFLYESSQWVDVPDEKMSLDNFQGCIQ